MAEFQELTSILKDLLTNRFAPKPNFIRGLLGDGLGNVKVSGKGKEDKSFVRFNRSSNETFEIFNKEVNPVDNWPVLIGELPGQPGMVQVVSTDWAVYEQTSWGESVGGLDKHSPTQEWPEGSPGSDPLNVYLRSIAPLKSFSLGSGSTQVFVSSFNYEYISTGTVWPGVPGIELGQGASTTPATGTQRMMGIYHNPQLNQLFGVTGSTIPFTLALEPPRPTFPAGVNPSAWIRLYGGQNTIAESDIFDARRLFGAYPPTGPAFGDLTGSYPNPQVQGIVGFPIEGNLSDNDALVFSGSSWQLSPQGGGAGANWPFANIKTLSVTDPDADFNNVFDAIAGISSGQELKIDPGLYILTGTATINTANTTFYSDDPENTIFSGTFAGFAHLFTVQAANVTFDGLTLSATSSGNFSSVIATCNDGLQIKNCNILKLGTLTVGGIFSIGVWNCGGENWQIENTTITANDAIGTGTHVAYNADSALSSAEFTDGKLDGKDNDIRLNNASASVELNDPTLENNTLTLTAGTATGKYIDGATSNVLFLNDVGVGTTAPEKRLHVQDTSTSDLVFEVAGTSQKAYFAHNGPTAQYAINRDISGVFSDTASTSSIMNLNGLSGNSFIQFFTTTVNNTVPSLRMTIDSGGQVGIGVAPSFLLHLSADSAAKPTTNTWTISSDPRLKRRRGLYTRGLSWLRSLPKLISWTYNGLAGTPKTDSSVGFDAKELKKVAPEMTRKYRAKMHEKDAKEREILAVNDHDLKYAMLNTILEMADKIDELESRIIVLEA